MLKFIIYKEVNQQIHVPVQSNNIVFKTNFSTKAAIISNVCESCDDLWTDLVAHKKIFVYIPHLNSALFSLVNYI